MEIGMKQKKYDKRKIAYWNVAAAVLAIAVVLLCGFFSVWLCRRVNIKNYDNTARLLTAEQNGKIEQEIYEAGKYPYLVIDLSGRVLYSDERFQEKSGNLVNVQEMIQTDKSFSEEYPGMSKEVFVMERNGKIFGFIIYLIPEEDTGRTGMHLKMLAVMLPLLLASVFAVLLLVMRIIYCNRRILAPLREISLSSKQMIAGNYDYEVVRVYETKVADNEMGELIYSFELMRDELKNKQITEENLKRSQQELISCISHDLKTPLATIKAYAEGLRDGIARDAETKKSYTRIIIEKTDLLIGMIGDLLKFSNAQLNQLEINRKEVFFQSYFERVMQELKVFAEQRGMKFFYQTEASDMIVTIDERRITEVLYNLVENSMKYRTEEGELQITAKRRDHAMWISVADNGIGINADDIPYVFEKFYRAEKSRSSSVPGSGLGLSICKYIVEQHGGEIYCRSRKNEGCEISFSIF